MSDIVILLRSLARVWHPFANGGTLDKAADDIEFLRARLEWRPDGRYDGIHCRDITIAQQDAALRASCETMEEAYAALNDIRAENAALREENDRLLAANRDLMNHFDDARDEAESMRAKLDDVLTAKEAEEEARDREWKRLLSIAKASGRVA